MELISILSIAMMKRLCLCHAQKILYCHMNSISFNEAVDPLTESDSFGENLFIETLFMVNNFLHP